MLQSGEYLGCMVIDSDSIIGLETGTLMPTVGPITESSVL